jgi:hypothetical protein
LTPPCYQLQKPPETAALFCSLVGAVTPLETMFNNVAGLSLAAAQ